MAGSTTRKRPTGQTRKKDPAPEPEQAAEPSAPSPSSNGADQGLGANDRAETLTNAYNAALEARGDDGEMPNGRLEAVERAYVAIPKRDRGQITANLNAQSTAHMIREDGTADTGLIHAIATLSALFSEHYDEATVTPHDPIPGLAGMVAAAEHHLGRLQAKLTDEDRERLAAIDIATNDQAQAAYDATVAAYEKVEGRVMNGHGRKRSAGYSGPRRDLGALVRHALQEADGNRLSFSDACRLCDISNGALIKRWRNDNIDGVRAVGEDDGGKRAFELA